jgi:hypothetical protein
VPNTVSSAAGGALVGFLVGLGFTVSVPSTVPDGATGAGADDGGAEDGGADEGGVEDGGAEDGGDDEGGADDSGASHGPTQNTLDLRSEPNECGVVTVIFTW